MRALQAGMARHRILITLAVATMLPLMLALLLVPGWHALFRIYQETPFGIAEAAGDIASDIAMAQAYLDQADAPDSRESGPTKLWQYLAIIEDYSGTPASRIAQSRIVDALHAMSDAEVTLVAEQFPPIDQLDSVASMFARVSCLHVAGQRAENRGDPQGCLGYWRQAQDEILSIVTYAPHTIDQLAILPFYVDLSAAVDGSPAVAHKNLEQLHSVLPPSLAKWQIHAILTEDELPITYLSTLDERYALAQWAWGRAKSNAQKDETIIRDQNRLLEMAQTLMIMDRANPYLIQVAQFQMDTARDSGPVAITETRAFLESIVEGKKDLAAWMAYYMLLSDYMPDPSKAHTVQDIASILARSEFIQLVKDVQLNPGIDGDTRAMAGHLAGMACLFAGQYSEAAESFQYVLDTFGAGSSVVDSAAYHWVYTSRLAGGMDDLEALAEYNAICTLYAGRPGATQARFALADIYLRRQEYAEAFALFEQASAEAASALLASPRREYVLCRWVWGKAHEEPLPSINRPMFSKANELALDLLTSMPDNPYLGHIAAFAIDSAQQQGESECQETLAALEEIGIEYSGYLAGWVSRIAVVSHLQDHHELAGIIRSSAIARDLIAPDQIKIAQSVLVDPDADADTKAFAAMQIGEAYEVAGEPKEARGWFKSALDEYGRIPWLAERAAFHHALCHSLTEPVVTEKMIGLFSDMITEYPNGDCLSDVHYALGNLHLRSGDREAAVAEFDIAQSIARDDELRVHALLQLGATLHHMARYKQSETTLDQILDAFPSHPQAGVALALRVDAALNAEGIEGAEAVLRLFVENYPASTHRALAQARLEHLQSYQAKNDAMKDAQS